MEPFKPNEFLMRFRLSNRTDREKVVRYYEPFTEFKLQVTAGGHALQVLTGGHEGPLGITDLHVPPHGSVDLESRNRLVFGSAAEPAELTVTVNGTPPVEIVANVHIDDEVVDPCTASIAAP